MDKRKTLGVVTATGLTAVGLMLSTLAFSNYKTSTRLKASDYTLTLNSSNGISGSNVTTTKNITTDSGAYEVEFGYTNCSSYASGHATINAGGKIVNNDHIRSITSLVANFETSGELKFRTSYDGATWGGYTSMKASEEYSLGSNPYYVEFTTDGTHSVNLKTVQFSYSCLENTAANGTEVEGSTYYQLCTSDSDLVAGDLYVIASVNDGEGFALTATVANSYYLSGEAITVSDGKFTVDESSSICPLKLGGTSGAYTFADSNNPTNYLYDGGSYNSLYWMTTGTTWTINLTDAQIYSATPHYLYYRESYSTFTSYQYGSSYKTYIFHQVTEAGGTQYDEPVDENGFTAVDTNKDNYKTNSIFDSANGLVVKATFTDGTTQTLTKGANGYTYAIKNSSGSTINTAAAFGTEDVYTLYVYYKNYIPVEITLNVGVYLEMTSIVVSSDVLTYNTADKLSDYLAGHVTATIGYSNSAYNKNNVAYNDFGTYGLTLSLLNPSGVTYSTTDAFGTAGTWKIKVANSNDATVYGELEITVNAIMVQTITLDNDTLTLQQTKTAQLKVTVNPTNATNTAVTWASDDESVATVSANGVVTGVGVGTCNITATAADGSGVVGTCAVTVTAYEGAVDEGTFVLNTSGAPTVGSYVVIASSYEGSAYAMSSTQATNNRSGVSVTIENQVIERDSNSGFGAFLVTEGNTDGTIAFYDEANGGYLYAASSSKNYLRTESTLSDNSSFTVTGDEAKTIEAQGTNSRNLLKWNSQSTLFSCYASGQANPYIFEKGGEVVYPTSISLSGETAIGVGGSSQLTVSYTPSNTTVKSVTWTSSDDTVAGVSNGLVTGIKAGSATITATAVAENGTITASANVVVSNVAVTGVSLDKATASIAKDGTVTLTPTIAPSNATNKNVTWSTSDNSVATVNGGVVTGISAGTATITVTTEDGNKTASCEVTVTSSGSGTGASGSLVIKVSDFVTTSYAANDGTHSTTVGTDSYSWTSSQVMKNGSEMQWKKSNGYIYNTDPISGLTNITISSISSGTFTVYSGTSENPSSNEMTMTSDNAADFPSGVSYFKIKVGSDATGKCGDITINFSTTPVDPTAISVSPSTFELSAGKTKTLSVSYTPSNANQNKAVTWSSSNTNVATVDTSGIVTVKENASVGATATITATLTNLTSIKATATVTVVEQALADHTVLIYMCGADLESSYASSNQGLATGDITEILNIANQPDDVNIVIETGGASKWSSTYGISSTYLQRWHVEDQTLKLDDSLTYASMGASSTLQSFIEYGLNNYPASRTGLVLWNHGGAMRGVCYDEKKNDDNLLDYEVISAVSGAFSSTGRTDKLEWIGYDACLMGVQDIAEFNSEYFNYMIASEESEAGYGWDYDTWVDDLYANKATTVILKAIVDGFITDNGGTNSSSNDQTLAYYNLSYAAEYMQAWEAMASQLSITSSNKSSFNTLVKECKYYADTDYTYFGLFDAKDFINKLAANSTFNPGSTYTNAVLIAHSNLVAYSSCGKGAGNSYGVAMFWSAASDSGKSTYYTSSTTHFSTWRSIVSTYGS